jgi:peptidyl-prolyl cis-trans isomerase B (cyclophilin B)
MIFFLDFPENPCLFGIFPYSGDDFCRFFMKHLLFLFSFVFLLPACVNQQSNSPEPVPETPPVETKSADQEEVLPFSQDSGPQKGDTIALMQTSMGDIKIRLFPDEVPTIVENFVTLAERGYYEGVIFHRVIDGFMIQGGDPTGTGRGGESAWGGRFDDEFSPNLSNIEGSISMANAGPDTNGSQFFINQVDNVNLDYDKMPLTSKHAVFGQVYEGMDVVNEIASVPTVSGNKPAEDVVIESVTIAQFEE